MSERKCLSPPSAKVFSILGTSLVSAFIALANAYGQVAEDWTIRYDGPAQGWDSMVSVIVDSAGGICLTGFSEGRFSRSDYLTMKYDSEGKEVWSARYDGSGSRDDRPSALAVDVAGNVYVTGSSYGDSITHTDYATVKYGPDGSLLWVERYNGPGNWNDYPLALAVDTPGNVYVTGSSVGDDQADGDYTTIKYDEAGSTLWTARYNGPGNGNDGAVALSVDRSGYVHVSGGSEGNYTGTDYTTIKYDANANGLWLRRYNGPANFLDSAKDLCIDDLGNVFVTGASSGVDTYTDYATIKYNAEGDSLWAVRYNGAGEGGDWAKALAVDSEGCVYVTGGSVGRSLTIDCTTIKYDENGKELWEAKYEGPQNGADYGDALVLDSWGNVYVTGRSSGTFSDFDIVTLKYGSDGNELWVARYDGPANGDDYPNAIALDRERNVYVTGASEGSAGLLTYDCITIKYRQEPLRIAPSDSTNRVIPHSCLLQNFPNPFNPSTIVQFHIAESSRAVLQIYNIRGHLVRTLLDEERAPGSYFLFWDGKDNDGKALSSGVFLLRLSAGGKVQTRKMSLLR